MNDQLTPESQSSDIASTTDRAPTEEAAPTPLTTAPISSVTGYSNMSVKHSEKPASVIKVATTFSPTDANVTAATPTKTVPSINQTMIDASDSESAKASQAAASKEAADASTKAAADEAAAKKASDDAAAQQAADRADADKKKADDAATTSVKSVSHASSDDSSATSDDNDQSSAVDSILSGISQVFGQDGSAKGTFFYQVSTIQVWLPGFLCIHIILTKMVFCPFFQGGAAGACGTVNADSTPLVALPTSLYADGKHCGKQVMIKNTANGKSVVAKVQDMCPGCPSDTSLDVSRLQILLSSSPIVEPIAERNFDKPLFRNHSSLPAPTMRLARSQPVYFLSNGDLCETLLGTSHQTPVSSVHTPSK